MSNWAYRLTSIFCTTGTRLRSSSKTPRVWAQPPQTYTGILWSTANWNSSSSGGWP